MAFVARQFRDAGIVVPFIVNDNLVEGYFAPGSGLGAVDIYAIDVYPLRYDCGQPYVWPTDRFLQDWQTTHRKESLSTPFAIAEFQGGSGDGWYSSLKLSMNTAADFSGAAWARTSAPSW